MEQKKQAERILKGVALYKRVLGTRQGELLVADLARHYGLVTPQYPKSEIEALIQIGEQNVVKRILHTLKIDMKTLMERIEQYENQAL